MRNDRETLLRYLPEGWEEAARGKGALKRARKIKSAEDLLYLNLLHFADSGSCQNTATLMALSTDIHLNKEAVRKRIGGSGPWLQWMGRGLCLKQGYVIEKPRWLADRRVLLVDATDIALRGSITSDYRLHYAFDLFAYLCAQMELTDIAQGGERLSRYALMPGDIVVADRIYGTIAGMEHVRSAGADFVVRLRTNAFVPYDESGERIDLLSRLQVLQPWETLSLNCFYRNGQGEKRPVRIAATRKDADTSRTSAQKLTKTSIRKRGREPSPSAMGMSEYIVLATSLQDMTEQILELYRARWQIEQVFRRLKGLFGIGEPPGKNSDSVKSWFYGKLLLAALCEAMAKEQVFPPR